MKRIKQRIYAGSTCDQIVYTASDRSDTKTAQPRLRFKTEEEREQHKHNIGLRNFIRLVNENFTPAGFYATFTFSSEYEQYYFEEAKKIRENFIRKIKRKFPDAKIVCVMGRGKGTKRIHMHMIFENADPAEIAALWIYGIVDCSPLRKNNKDPDTGKDIGTDYTALATYLYEHWTPEQGGHAYTRTKNLRKPEKEEPTEAARNYTAEHPPLPPKGYEYVKCTANTTYGFQCFHYVKIRKAESGTLRRREMRFIS